MSKENAWTVLISFHMSVGDRNESESFSTVLWILFSFNVCNYHPPGVIMMATDENTVGWEPEGR